MHNLKRKDIGCYTMQSNWHLIRIESRVRSGMYLKQRDGTREIREGREGYDEQKRQNDEQESCMDSTYRYYFFFDAFNRFKVFLLIPLLFILRLYSGDVKSGLNSFFVV